MRLEPGRSELRAVPAQGCQPPRRKGSTHDIAGMTFGVECDFRDKLRACAGTQGFQHGALEEVVGGLAHYGDRGNLGHEGRGSQKGRKHRFGAVDKSVATTTGMKVQAIYPPTKALRQRQNANQDWSMDCLLGHLWLAPRSMTPFVVQQLDHKMLGFRPISSRGRQIQVRLMPRTLPQGKETFVIQWQAGNRKPNKVTIVDKPSVGWPSAALRELGSGGFDAIFVGLWSLGVELGAQAEARTN